MFFPAYEGKPLMCSAWFQLAQLFTFLNDELISECC